jgi:DNA-binding transcriptional MerR regulator
VRLLKSMNFYLPKISIGQLVESAVISTDKVQEILAPLAERKYYINQLGIARNTFLNWKELLLYPNETPGWRKFSFIEAVWIKCIETYRKLGVSTEGIKKVKQLFIENDKRMLELHYESIKATDLSIANKEKALQGLQRRNELSAEDWAQIYSETQMHSFGFFVLSCIIEKTEFCIALNIEGEFELLSLGTVPKGLEKQNSEVLKKIFNRSFVLINIWDIILSLVVSGIEIERKIMMQIISPKEQAILDAVRDSEFEEIIIKKDKSNEPIHIALRNREITPEVLHRLKANLKRASYEDISFKQRDGKIISYEKTRHVKLK